MTKLNKFLWITAFLFSVISVTRASTTVSSIISSNQVWTAANSPYIVNYNILVNTGVSVKVMPGVTVQSTGNYRIIVDGEFIAEGTYDSVITMDKIDFDFSTKAVGYDFINNQGSHFSYCLFNGNQLGYRTILLNKISLLISNCKFMNCYYTVYATNSSYDTTKIVMLKCIFDSNNANVGYPANVNGQNTYLEMDECLVKKMAGLFIPSHTKITRSTFLNCITWGGIRIPSSSKFSPGECIFKCNTFRNFKTSVMEIMGADSFMKLNIEENTFDSSDNFIVMNFYTKPSCKPIVKNNNFLYYKNYTFKFAGGSAGISDPFDLTGNYWGTTDTLKIAAGIYDFKDDITVSPLADHSGILTSMVTTCNEGSSIRSIEKTTFSMYPNPAVTNFTITFKNEGLHIVHIYNMMGDLVFSEKTDENEMQTGISSLVNGLYVVEVISEGKQSGIQKLIINK